MEDGDLGVDWNNDFDDDVVDDMEEECMDGVGEEECRSVSSSSFKS